MNGLTEADAHALAASQTAMEVGDNMGNVEMFPSSAVAQSHVPGSAAIGTLQHPPLHPSHQHHTRTSSISQNPSLDNNKHNRYRASNTDTNGVSVSVSCVTQTDHQQDIVEQHKSTVTTTSTATNSAIMMDDTVPHAPAPAPVAKDAAITQTDNDKEANAAAVANAAPPNDNSAVRKIR